MSRCLVGLAVALSVSSEFRVTGLREELNGESDHDRVSHRPRPIAGNGFRIT